MRIMVIFFLCLSLCWPVKYGWAQGETQGETTETVPSKVGEVRKEEKKAARATRTAEVERGGALVAPWRLVVQPEFEYDHISGQNVALSGFTIFQAILIGTVTVSRIKRDIFVPAVTLRLGIPPLFKHLNDSELSLRVPYVFRSDQLTYGGTGAQSGTTKSTSIRDNDIGDLELTYYYHLIREGRWRAWVPDTILRLGSRFPTGKDPYSLQRELIPGLGLVPVQFPTGTGHYNFNAGLNFVKSADPAVLFFNFTYYYNFPRDVGVQGGIDWGTVTLGQGFEYNVGLIFALQEKLSLNFYLKQLIVGSTSSHGVTLPDTSLNAITFNIGATYMPSPRWAFDFVVGIGLSQDAPDVSILIRLPMTFELGGH
jgi:hypothetical protein